MEVAKFPKNFNIYFVVIVLSAQIENRGALPDIEQTRHLRKIEISVTLSVKYIIHLVNAGENIKIGPCRKDVS